MDIGDLKNQLDSRLSAIVSILHPAPVAKAKPAAEEKKGCACAKDGQSGGTCKCAEVHKTDDESEDTNITVTIAKAIDDKQIVIGVVLQPEVVDAQGDIMSAAVIEKAAHTFLANYNKATRLGLQHKVFKGGMFDLVESYLAPMDMSIGSMVVKSGSWIMAVKVLDADIWKAVKDGKIKGFSIGGKAKVQRLKTDQGEKGAQ